MVYFFEAQVAVVLDGQSCGKANVYIRLDKMMDFYRVYLMIGVEWEGAPSTTPDCFAKSGAS